MKGEFVCQIASCYRVRQLHSRHEWLEPFSLATYL